MSIKKARKTLQNKEKFNYDILDKVANSGCVQSAGIGKNYFLFHDLDPPHSFKKFCIDFVIAS